MFFIVAQSCRKCKGALLLFADDSCKICAKVRKKAARLLRTGRQKADF